MNIVTEVEDICDQFEEIERHIDASKATLDPLIGFTDAELAAFEESYYRAITELLKSHLIE